MVDGGEGLVDALVDATGGEFGPINVTGPIGRSVPSFVGWLGGVPGSTAVIEMEAAAGVRLVLSRHRNAMTTTRFGVGALIRYALDHGAERILLSCGDSGINDGGASMAQALGPRLLDDQNRDPPLGGGALAYLQCIDVTDLDQRLQTVQFDVAVDWHNTLLGERNVARVFGPQKGATPEQVVLFEQALERYAGVLLSTFGHDYAALQGSGSCGGFGVVLAAFCGATLRLRDDIVMSSLRFDA